MRKFKIKIGLDFHGVITDRPEYFSAFSKAVKERGYELHIITGGPRKTVEDYLKSHNIYYTVVFAILDFYDAQGEVKYFSNGEFKVPDKLWNSAKAEYCLSQGINIHIDDGTQYEKWFTTPFCHYEAETNTCRIGDCVTIDLSKDADNVLCQIEEMLKTTQFY